jgi:hypothetical protein
MRHATSGVLTEGPERSAERGPSSSAAARPSRALCVVLRAYYLRTSNSICSTTVESLASPMAEREPAMTVRVYRLTAGSVSRDRPIEGAIASRVPKGAILDRRRVTVDENTPLVEVHLSQISVRGRLLVGSHGMPADLAFTSTGLNSGKRVSTKSNEDGFFSAVLPSEGSWNVRIMPAGRLAYVIRRGIDVHQRDDLPSTARPFRRSGTRSRSRFVSRS